MQNATPRSERALRVLQGVLRQAGAPPASKIALSRSIPDDLAQPGHSTLFLGFEEKRSLAEAVAAVGNDLRFEHLDKKTDERVWRFACLAALDRSRNHVTDFVHEHAIDPKQLTCFFPIESLRVDRERVLPNSTLLPTDAGEVPPEQFGFVLTSPVESVLAVPAQGTHFKRMAQRAGAAADHDLRALRIGLRQHRSIADRQLRFRRGMGFAFDERLAGWTLSADTSWDLRLNDELYDLAQSSPITMLPFEPSTDVEHQAVLALRWIERDFLAVDPLESLLFFFFALEALLGDKAEKLKARGLAFRRVMLSAATTETFSDPNRMYYLYDEVRSAAVHGGIPPAIDEQDARRFGWDVRDALIEYLQFAGTRQIAKRGKLLRALDTHPARAQLVSSLKEFGGAIWEDFPDSAAR